MSLTLHPDEQARELFYELKPECQAHSDGCKGCAEAIASIAALLAKARLAEAEWWHTRGDDRMQECWERLQKLRQAAGEGPCGKV